MNNTTLITGAQQTQCDLMLAQRLRRRTNIVSALGLRILLLGWPETLRDNDINGIRVNTTPPSVHLQWGDVLLAPTQETRGIEPMLF